MTEAPTSWLPGAEGYGQRMLLIILRSTKRGPEREQPCRDLGLVFSSERRRAGTPLLPGGHLDVRRGASSERGQGRRAWASEGALLDTNQGEKMLFRFGCVFSVI